MPDGSYVRATFGSLQAGEQDFASIYAQVVSITETLQNQLNASLGSWDGQARDAYNVARAKWTAAEESMAATLSNLRAVVGEASVSYPATESANAAAWG
jgi:early secretory antigenic target protein ESAT-6